MLITVWYKTKRISQRYNHGFSSQQIFSSTPSIFKVFLTMGSHHRAIDLWMVLITMISNLEADADHCMVQKKTYLQSLTMGSHPRAMNN